jgi:ribosome-associated translation inhibitor RaiA
MNGISENSVANPLSSGISAEDAVKSIENDREFKAFIYQHLVELQPYLAPESQVAVLIQLEQDEDAPDDNAITMTLVATLGEYKLEAEGRHTDMYEAFILAKENMLAQLEEYFNLAIDTTEREAQIRSMLEGNQTLH